MNPEGRDRIELTQEQRKKARQFFVSNQLASPYDHELNTLAEILQLPILSDQRLREAARALMVRMIPLIYHQNATYSEIERRMIHIKGCPGCRLESDIESALKAALDAPAENREHEYLSTACYHAQHDRCRKECKFCSVACNCACHIDAPAQQPPAPATNGDVVEKMSHVFDTYFTEPVIHTAEGDRERMTAALQVAREGYYALADVEKAIISLYCFAVGNHISASEFAKNVRARLKQLEKQERVTVVPWIHDPSRWIVLRDGWNCSNTSGFVDKRDAEIYAEGLRAKLLREEKGDAK